MPIKNANKIIKNANKIIKNKSKLSAFIKSMHKKPSINIVRSDLGTAGLKLKNKLIDYLTNQGFLLDQVKSFIDHKNDQVRMRIKKHLSTKLDKTKRKQLKEALERKIKKIKKSYEDKSESKWNEYLKGIQNKKSFSALFKTFRLHEKKRRQRWKIYVKAHNDKLNQIVPDDDFIKTFGNELKKSLDKVLKDMKNTYMVEVKFDWRIDVYKTIDNQKLKKSRDEESEEKGYPWRTNYSVTVALKTNEVPDDELEDIAYNAANQEARTHMGQSYSPEIKNVRIGEIKKVSNIDDILNSPLYGKGWDYNFLKIQSEYDKNKKCVDEFMKEQYPKLYNKIVEDKGSSVFIAITASQFKSLMEDYKKPCYIVDLMLNCILHIQIDKNDKFDNSKSIIVCIANNHIYEVKDKKMRKQIVSRSNSKKQLFENNLKSNKFKSNSDEANYVYRQNLDNKQIYNLITNHDKKNNGLVKYYTNEQDLNAAFSYFIKNNQVPDISLRNNSINTIYGDNISLECMPDGEKHLTQLLNLKQEVKKKLKFDLKIAGYGSMAYQLAEFLKVKIHCSQMSDTLHNLFDYTKTGGLNVKYFHKDSKGNILYSTKDPPIDSMRGIDIKNMYPSTLLDSLNQITVFDIHSHIEWINLEQSSNRDSVSDNTFTHVEPYCFYLVDHNCYELGDMLLHFQVVKDALDLKLIKKENIKAIIRGHPMGYGHDSLKNYIETMLKLKAGKFLANSYIGLLARMKRVKKFKTIICKTFEEASYYYNCYGDKSYSKIVTQYDDDDNLERNSTSDKTLSHVVDLRHLVFDIYNNKPIYLQITQLSRMKMIKKMFELETLGIKVFEIKTDCLFFHCTPTNKKYVKWAKNNVFPKKKCKIGQFKIESKPKIKRSFKNRLRSENNEAVPLNREVDFICLKVQSEKKIETKQINKAKIQDVLKYKRALITGCGGSGKSYLASQIIQQLSQNNQNVHVMAPTNIASLVLNKEIQKNKTETRATTIHSGLRMSISSDSIKNLKQIKEADAIILDEVGMLSSKMWSIFINILREFPEIRFYCFGDHRQCLPVESNAKSLDQLPCINELFDIQINLTHNYRTGNDLDYVNYCNSVHDTNKETFNYTDFKHEITDFCLTKTNILRKAVNTYWMKKIISFSDSGCNPHGPVRSGNSPDYVFYKAPVDVCESTEEDMWVYKGLPLQCIDKEIATKFNIPSFKREQWKVIKLEHKEPYYKLPPKKNEKNRKPDYYHYYWKIKSDFSNKEVVVSGFDLSKVFVPAYAMTINSLQGQTIDRPYTILESGHMSNKDLYTALTRTSKKEHVNISNETFGVSPDKLHYIYKLIYNGWTDYIYNIKCTMADGSIKEYIGETKNFLTRKYDDIKNSKDLERKEPVYIGMRHAKKVEFGILAKLKNVMPEEVAKIQNGFIELRKSGIVELFDNVESDNVDRRSHRIRAKPNRIFDSKDSVSDNVESEDYCMDRIDYDVFDEV